MKENKQDILHSLRVFFPRLSEEQLQCMSTKPKKVTNPDLSQDINKLSDVLFPISEVTGNPENLIDKVMNPNTSELERNRALSFLQRIPPSKRNNLSDEDLMNLLPSRYNSTLTDIDKVRDYIQTELDNSAAEDKDSINENEVTQNE